MSDVQTVFDKMLNSWPAEIVARSEVAKFTGGALNPRTLANLDSLGKGPEGRFKMGRKNVYDKQALVDWLVSRTISMAKKRAQN